ncbi:MAG: exonuclease [Aequorivita sp.]|mgnify:CR=1 FL=1|nr:exonuclease [Aequorivita sp.]|tara:strand:+ start:24839 stop:25438 length:600 start_codon:yes stop_codon:yes gene_type:complete
MFKIIDVEQGTDEWFTARLGKFTASNFAKVLSPTGKPSTQVKDLINNLVAEKLTGEREETFKSSAMERGNELESEAFDFVNFTHGYNFQTVGFCDSEQGYGCSPDGLDQEKKIGLELKCPLAKTHVKYLRSGKLPNEYFSQVQGSMMVTGYSQWIFVSYHPLMKPFILMVDRDEEYISTLREMLKMGATEVNRVHAELK